MLVNYILLILWKQQQPYFLWKGDIMSYKG